MRLTGLDTSRVDLVKRGAVRDPLNPTSPQRLLLYKAEDPHDAKNCDVCKAELSGETRGDLPDSAFADQKNRKFPHHFQSGAVDKAHLRNALSRVAQNPDPKVAGHLDRHAEQLGIGDGQDTKKSDSILHKIHKTLGDFLKADGDNNPSGMDSDAMQAIRGALDTISPHMDDLPPDVKDAFDEMAEAADYSPEEPETEAETAQESPAESTPAEPTEKGDDPMPDDDKKKELTKEEVLKAAMETLPVPIRELLQKQEADLKAAQERTEKAEAIAKAERDIRLTNDFVAKAQASLGYLPPVEFTGKVQKADGSGEQDLVGWAALMKSLSEKAPAEYVALEKALTTASTQIEQSNLFKEVGSVAPGNGNSAVAKIEGKAEALRKSEAGKGLSKEQAIAQVLKEDPKLYGEYNRELEGAGRR